MFDFFSKRKKAKADEKLAASVKAGEAHLGTCGRLVSSSKTGYWARYPDNLVVFNANLCTKWGKFWFGDMDVTREFDTVQKLADELKETVYVLSEHDARFEYEDSPRLEKARKVITPNE